MDSRRYKAFGVEDEDRKFTPANVTLDTKLGKPYYGGVYVPIRVSYDDPSQKSIIKVKTTIITSVGCSRFEEAVANPLTLSLRLNDTALDEQNERGALTGDALYDFQVRQKVIAVLNEITDTIKNLLKTEEVLNVCKSAIHNKTHSKISISMDAWNAAVDLMSPYSISSKDGYRETYYTNPKVFSFNHDGRVSETSFSEKLDVDLPPVKIPYNDAIDKYHKNKNMLFQVVAVIAIDSVRVKIGAGSNTTPPSVSCKLQTKLDSLLVLSLKPLQEEAELVISDRLLRAAAIGRSIKSSTQTDSE